MGVRIKAEDLQWKSDSFHQEEFENTDDIIDLEKEYGRRLEDGFTKEDDDGGGDDIIEDVSYRIYCEDKKNDSVRDQ